jgi:hypothetical protein
MTHQVYFENIKTSLRATGVVLSNTLISSMTRQIVQVTEEAFSSQKRPSNTSKHDIFKFFYFSGSFLLSWIWIPNPFTDPIESGSNPDPDTDPDPVNCQSYSD